MRTVSLSEITKELESGGRPTGGATDESAGILSLGGEHVSGDGSLSLGTKRFVPLAYFERMRRGRLQRDDILIVKDGATTGKVGFVDSHLALPAAVNEHVFRLAVDTERAHPRYVFFHLFSPTGNRQILKDFRGATVGGISQDFSEQVEIPLPDLTEQRRIAERLEQADRLRRTLRYALELTDAFLPAAFLQLFGDPEENPLGWSESELGELCEEVLDCSHSTPIYTATPTPHPCVRSSDIQKGHLDFSEAKYVSPREYQRLIARGKPMRGDVIYCREGARFGNAGRIVDKTEMCLGQRTMLFRANSKVAVGEFIWAFLSSRGAYGQATRALDGSASPHVNVGEIVNFRVPVPPLSLQQRFASMCERVDHLRAVQREALRQAEHVFASLLDRAFSAA
jgi:type I restriction enzyme S subunit